MLRLVPVPPQSPHLMFKVYYDYALRSIGELPSFFGLQDFCLQARSKNITMIAMDCKCLRCGHKWVARDETRRPLQCPQCKQPRWDVPAGAVRQGRPPGITNRKRKKAGTAK